MVLLYFIIGFLVSCFVYVLGKKGHLSEYMYICYNYRSIDDDKIRDFSDKRYGSRGWMDSSNCTWAYIQLIILILIWPLVLIFLFITKLFSKLIKEKKSF